MRLVGFFTSGRILAMAESMEAEECAYKKKTKRASGVNCCMPQCHTTSVKCRGLSFLRLPRKGVSADRDKWREALIAAIDRVDTSFNPDTARICSRHFDESCLTYGPAGKCSGLVMGSMPTHWMPVKSLVTPKTSRPEPTVREPPLVPERVYYWDFEDLRKGLAAITPPWMVKENSPTSVQLGLLSDHGWHILVGFTSDTGLKADVKVLGISAAHLSVDLETKSLKRFLADLQDMATCTGVTDTTLQGLAGPPDGKSSYYQHLLYKNVNGQLSHVSCVRSAQCQGLLPPQISCCKQCTHAEHLLKAKKVRQEARMQQPLKANDPLHGIQAAHLKAAFKQEREQRIDMQKKLEAFKKSLKTESVELSDAMHQNLSAVDKSFMDDPLQKLFWDEQAKAFQHKDRGMRWHPMIIRLAILLHSKSPAAYSTLRETGILKLPGSATLREYTSACQPQQGFQPSVCKELKKAADKLESHNRYVVLLHDEMTIKSDLVFDSRSGELVGFVNKSQWSFHAAGEKLATHALVFFVVGVSSDIKMSLGYFGTRGATSDELMPLLWTAIGCIEECGLKVIASTSDKASPNQRLYQLHHLPGQAEVCFKAVNLFAPERNVFFLSDPPHLIKTARNNLESSGKATRLLWNNGKLLLWQHILDVYNMDMQNGLRRTNLRLEHVHLTPHSKMNVRLAAQVLSQRVGRVLQNYGSPESQETAKFILLMDRFFDCLNSRHLYESDRSRKPDLKAYSDVTDSRFDFLQIDFLRYLEEWRMSVENRPGNFSKADRQKMFLTHQTYKGLVMTVHGFVGATKYLLSHGVRFVLSNRFCQDPLEEHFGRHRAMGRASENPNLVRFGYQENSLRLQRQLAMVVTPRGNVRGAQHGRHLVTIDHSPVKKKKTT